MIEAKYDLHIHSCLSPCGDNDMTPANIVGMAFISGLRVIAITDHNSCLNCAPAMKYGEEYGVIVIPGMELTTSEEIHVVCLFPRLENALRFSDFVYEQLMDIKCKPDIFGYQFIVGEDDEIAGEVEKLLISATDISIDDVDALMDEYEGLWFPAHIEKDANSVLSNLGMIPPDSKFIMAEIKDFNRTDEIIEENPYLERCEILYNSDAHSLGQIGRTRD